MSIWGKIIGATAGFAIGGPIGALVGGMAGHMMDKRNKNNNLDSEQEKNQISFTIAVIVLGAKMAKADGIVTSEEIKAFREVFHVPKNEIKNVGRIFDKAKQDSNGYEIYAKQVSQIFSSKPQVLEDLLEGLFHIAKADQVIHKSELQYLKNVANIFGISKNDFERIKEGHLTHGAADPYKVLGLTRESSDRDIKNCYKKLVKDNHPDALIAQGMPEEFIRVANEKLALINDAYDKIEKERRL